MLAIHLSQAGIALTGNIALLVKIRGIVRKFVTAKRVSIEVMTVAIAREMLPIIIPKRLEIRRRPMMPGIPVTKRTPRQ